MSSIGDSSFARVTSLVISGALLPLGGVCQDRTVQHMRYPSQGEKKGIAGTNAQSLQILRYLALTHLNQRGYPPGSPPDRVYHAARRSVTASAGGRLPSRLHAEPRRAPARRDPWSPRG